MSTSKPLSPEIITYLVKYRTGLSKRSRIIDLMTAVHPSTRFSIMLSKTEFDAFLNHPSKTFWLDLANPSEDLEFEPPINKELLSQYDVEQDDLLYWKAENQVELVERKANVYELIRCFRNWQVMTQEQKQLSDTKAMTIFGMDNISIFWRIVDSQYDVEPGDIVLIQNQKDDRSFFAYVNSSLYDKEVKDAPRTACKLVLQYLTDQVTDRIAGETDTFKMLAGMSSLSYDPGITTTVGRYLLNYLLAEAPFNKPRFPYCNEPWNIEGFHAQLADLMMAPKDPVTVDEFKKYANNFFFIGSFTELCVPSLTPKALGTDPSMKAYKRKLYMENKKEIDEGNPVVIAELESKLIDADKAYLKGDPSMRFYKPLGGKPFNIARKKMYLTVGGIEEFTKHGGAYNYIDRSLSEGWDPKAIPAIANEIRSGSYKRGHETQLGGAETKYIVRVFQDYCVNVDDCGTQNGILVDFSKVRIPDFIGRYVFDGGVWVPINAENLAKYANRKLIMRSPQTCQARNGLCYKCCGQKFSELDIKHLAMLLAELSSCFTVMALKSMHGTKLSVYEVNDLDIFEV